MLATSRLLVDPHDPWCQRGRAPLPEREQALVDAVASGDLPAVRRAVELGASPTFRLCRNGDQEHSSALGLAVCHKEALARALVRELLKSQAASHREMLQDFVIQGGSCATDATIVWFFAQSGTLSMGERSACWRALAARGRWPVILECRELLWGWECLHTGVNVYTASFVWARAVLSRVPQACIVKDWMRDVLLRFEEIDPGACKTLLDELALHYADENQSLPRAEVVEDLSRLLRNGSKMANMTPSRINPLVGSMLQDAIAKVASETRATELAHATAEVASDTTSARGRL